jgi:hypothetical protein
MVAEAGIRPHEANPLHMRRLAGCVFSICALLTLALPGPAWGRGSVAPKAVLTATTRTQNKAQVSRVVYSTWNGESFDRSRPPIDWPRRLRVRGSSNLAITIHTAIAPSVELRAWRRVRANGRPRERPELYACGAARARGCKLMPTHTAAGLAWRVTFDLRRSAGPYYLALNAIWEDAQVVWINHLRLN